MIFEELEWKRLEQCALAHYRNGFHPESWVTIEYDEKGNAVNLSRPLPEDADISTPENVYFKLEDFLPL